MIYKISTWFPGATNSPMAIGQWPLIVSQTRNGCEVFLISRHQQTNLHLNSFWTWPSRMNLWTRSQKRTWRNILVPAQGRNGGSVSRYLRRRYLPELSRWWSGYAFRKRVNGAFVNQPDLNAERTATVFATNNISIHQPTKIVLHINIATLIDRCQRPPNYPATLDINLEKVR